MLTKSNWGGGHLNNPTNKKGFTLIELLAVIVILSIISLITIPVVLNVVEKARIKAFKESVVQASKKVDTYMVKYNDYDYENREEVTVRQLKKIMKHDFTSGKYIIEDGQKETWYVTNGKYCAKGLVKNLQISKDCYKLDDTNAKIENEKIHVTSTSRSVKVVIDEGFAEDEESGIKEYRVSLYKENELKETQIVKTASTVTFDRLTHDTTYKVIVDVINGNDIGLEEENKYEEEIKTKKIDTPTYVVTPEGWAQSKTVTINYQDSDNKYTHEYSLDGGEEGTWVLSEGNTETIAFNENGTVIARVTDGKNYIDGSSQTISEIDTTPPSCELVISNYTLEQVTIEADCTDEGIGTISKYEFSNDGGSYVTQTSNTKTINSIKISTFKIKVTDSIENKSDEYTLSDEEKNKFYEAIYDILNEKYTIISNYPLLASYPVGSIYISTNSDENTVAKMTSKYGGEWEAYGTDRVLRGTTGTAGQTNGSSTATLTTNNLPSHTHSIPVLSGTAASTGSGYTLTWNTTGTNNATSANNNVGHTHVYAKSNANTGSTTLTISQLPVHSHDQYVTANPGTGGGGVRLDYVGDASGASPYPSGIHAAGEGGGQGHTHTISTTNTNTGGISANHTHAYTNRYLTSVSGVQAHTHTVSTTANTSGSTGSGQSFSVLDPYITVYMYKRTK